MYSGTSSKLIVKFSGTKTYKGVYISSSVIEIFSKAIGTNLKGPFLLKLL